MLRIGTGIGASALDGNGIDRYAVTLAGISRQVGPCRWDALFVTPVPTESFDQQQGGEAATVPRSTRLTGEGTKMSTTVHLSDVQLLNLSVLMTVQASLRRDPVAACCKFNLSADQARRDRTIRQLLRKEL